MDTLGLVSDALAPGPSFSLVRDASEPILLFPISHVDI